MENLGIGESGQAISGKIVVFVEPGFELDHLGLILGEVLPHSNIYISHYQILGH